MVKRIRSMSGASNTVMIVCLTALTCVTLTAVLIVFVAIPDDNSAAGRVAIITGFVGVVIPQILLLARQDSVGEKVEAIDSKTDQVLNGVMDRKLEAAVHRVLSQRNVAIPQDMNPDGTPQP